MSGYENAPLAGGAPEEVLAADQAADVSYFTANGWAIPDAVDDDGEVIITAAEQARALDIARALILAGVPVFVAIPDDNSPTGYREPVGWDNTSLDVDNVRWWEPGMALCAVGGHAVDFLDVDPRNGGAESASGLRNAGMWPMSYGRASTPSGGTHDLIAPLGVKSGELKREGDDGIKPIGIDIKGGKPDGNSRGYVFISPTIRISKETGKPVAYRWVEEPQLKMLAEEAADDDSGIHIAELREPAMKQQERKQKTKPSSKPSSEPSATAAGPAASSGAVLERITQLCKELSEAPDGSGNNTAARIAFMVGQYAGAGQADKETVISMLEAAVGGWAYKGANDFDAMCRTIRSQVEYGITKPRAWEKRGGSKGVEVPLNLPDSFWSARPYLSHIRQAALSADASPDLVLGAVLSRLSSLVHHGLRFQSYIGDEALNFYAAMVTQSSGGKSLAKRVGTKLVKLPAYLGLDFYDGVGLTSGEGIAEAYMGVVKVETGETDSKGKPKTKDARMQVRNNLFAYVDEGGGLVSVMERQNSILGPILRSAGGGETLGQVGAKAETTRFIPAGSYTFGLLIGFQFTTVQPLFLAAEVSAGTPQRFAYFAANPLPPEDAVLPEWPGELDVRLIKLTEGGVPVPRKGFITMPDSANAEIRRMRRDNTVETIDGHKPRMLCKTAALLAILDNRFQVNEEDWALAKVMWDTSCAVRDSAIAYGRKETAAAILAKEDAQVKLAVRMDGARADAEEKRADAKVVQWAVRLANKVHDGGAPMSKRDLGKSMNNATRREYFDGALQHAIDQKWVTVGDRDTVSEGPSKPA